MKIKGELTILNNTTIGFQETLLGTLDVATFLNGIREFDGVTQQQCMLKARKELLKPAVSSLHGSERTKTAMTAICATLEAMALGN